MHNQRHDDIACKNVSYHTTPNQICIYAGEWQRPPSHPRDGHGPSHPPPVVVVWCYGGGSCSHPPLWLWCGAMVVVVVVRVVEEVEVVVVPGGN